MLPRQGAEHSQHLRSRLSCASIVVCCENQRCLLCYRGYASMELQERHHSGVEDRRYFPAQLGCPQILSPTTGAVACGVVCDLNYPVVVGCEDGSPGKRRNQPVGRRRLHVLECTDDGLVDLVTLDLVKGRKDVGESPQVRC